MKRSKTYRAQIEKFDKEKTFVAEEAFALLKEHAKAKFDESVEVHVRLNIDPKKGDQAVRGSVVLPHGTGKSARIGVITSTKADDAKKAGATVVGGEDLIDKIKDGDLPDVDVLVASPDMMPKLASAARVLGPRGLMPSPKTDTVTDDITGAVTALTKGKSSFKNDGGGIVHQVIGKVSFDAKQLEENFSAFISAITDCKTSAHKNALISRISICSTMSPSMRVKNPKS